MSSRKREAVMIIDMKNGWFELLNEHGDVIAFTSNREAAEAYLKNPWLNVNKSFSETKSAAGEETKDKD